MSNRNNNLNRELAKKICADLGAIPESIGKAGLTHKDLLVKKTINVLQKDDTSTLIEYKVWYGEASGSDGKTCCLITVLGDNSESFEVNCIIGFKGDNNKFFEDSFCFGIIFDYLNDEDDGRFFIKSKDRWLPLMMAQKLQLALGFEILVQEGVVWEPVEGSNTPESLWKNLTEIIELD